MQTRNSSIEWLRQKAAIEDEGLVSVGGLAFELERRVGAGASNEEAGRCSRTICPNPSIDWLRQKAAIEDESLVSVGGLAHKLEESVKTGTLSHQQGRASKASCPNPSIDWLLQRAAIEDESLVSVGGLSSQLHSSVQPATEAPQNLPWHQRRPFADLRSYVRQIGRLLSTSESLLPEQRCDLSRNFVMPTVICVGSGSTGAAVISAMMKHQRVFLSAEAGAGKTSLLRYLTLEVAQQFKSGLADSLPVYLSLREWTANQSFEHFLFNTVNHFGASHLHEQFTNRWKVGGLTLFLDGFDEVLDQHQQAVMSEIRRAAEIGSKCRFFISSRSKEDASTLHDFETFEIAAPSNRQKIQMIKSQLRDKYTTCAFWARLQAESDLQAPASNPLLLTLLAARYARSELNPHDISNVLAHIIDTLIDEWDAARGVVRTRDYWAAPNQKLALLKRVAAELVLRDQDAFSLEDFKTWLERLAGLHDYDRILNGLVEHSGLLQRVSQAHWQFSHPVYRDFLAASFSVEKSSGVEDYPRTSTESATYRRSLRFLCGRASDATDLVSLISGRGACATWENAVILAEALSQNLSIDKAATGHACSYITRVLEDLVRSDTKSKQGGITIEAIRKGERLYELNYPDTTPQSIQTAEATSELVNAVSKARDGIAKEYFAENMLRSSVPLVKDIGLAFRNGTRLTAALSKRKTRLTIQSSKDHETCDEIGFCMEEMDFQTSAACASSND